MDLEGLVRITSFPSPSPTVIQDCTSAEIELRLDAMIRTRTGELKVEDGCTGGLCPE